MTFYVLFGGNAASRDRALSLFAKSHQSAKNAVRLGFAPAWSDMVQNRYWLSLFTPSPGQAMRSDRSLDPVWRTNTDHVLRARYVEILLAATWSGSLDLKRVYAESILTALHQKYPDAEALDPEDDPSRPFKEVLSDILRSDGRPLSRLQRDIERAISLPLPGRMSRTCRPSFTYHRAALALFQEGHDPLSTHLCHLLVDLTVKDPFPASATALIDDVFSRALPAELPFEADRIP